jgi:mitochondrial fission protein ELM1
MGNIKISSEEIAEMLRSTGEPVKVTMDATQARIEPLDAAKPAANETKQVDLLYRDIKLQMDELREIRPYKEAVEEIIKLIEYSHPAEEFNEVARIIKKHIKSK